MNKESKQVEKQEHVFIKCVAEGCVKNNVKMLTSIQKCVKKII